MAALDSDVLGIICSNRGRWAWRAAHLSLVCLGGFLSLGQADKRRHGLKLFPLSALRGGRSTQQPLGADVFVNLWPVDTVAASGNLPIA
jgi:hypothetical protein